MININHLININLRIIDVHQMKQVNKNFIQYITNFMSNLEQSLKQISNKYEQLKQSSDLPTKKQISQQLLKLCLAAQKQIENQTPSTKIFRHNAQISNIKNIAIQVNKQSSELIQKKKLTKYDLSSESKQVTKLSDQQKSKRIIRTIIQKQINSKSMKISPEQFQRMANKMQNNLDLVEQVKDFIKDQGDDLDLIEENITKVFQNVQESNKQLENAAQQSFKRRLMKIRFGITGALVAIGYGILGIPGMIVGGVIGLFKTV